MLRCLPVLTRRVTCVLWPGIAVSGSHQYASLVVSLFCICSAESSTLLVPGQSPLLLFLSICICCCFFEIVYHVYCFRKSCTLMPAGKLPILLLLLFPALLIRFWLVRQGPEAFLVGRVYVLWKPLLLEFFLSVPVCCFRSTSVQVEFIGVCTRREAWRSGERVIISEEATLFVLDGHALEPPSLAFITNYLISQKKNLKICALMLLHYLELDLKKTYLRGQLEVNFLQNLLEVADLEDVFSFVTSASRVALSLRIRVDQVKELSLSLF